MTFTFFKKTLVLLSITLITGTSIFCMSNQKEEIKTTTTTTEIKDVYQQKIDCPEMTMLNFFLLKKPSYALRLKSTYLNAREIINYFESKETKAATIKSNISESNPTKTTVLTTDEESKKVLELRDKILKPVSTFFTQLHATKGLLGGLINVIFKQTKFATTDEDLSKTLMLQFFQVDKQAAQTFFNDMLVTKEILLKCCKEFEVLFGVVDASLSPEVKKAADEAEKNAIADIIKKKQLALKNQDKQTKKPNPEQK